MLLGFSTGCLYKTHERIAKETFAFFRSLGCNAIELKCQDDEHILKLINEISRVDLLGFQYISLHAPITFTVETLELIAKAHEKFHFECIVIHPDEVENWEIFSRFDLPFAIENMDWTKTIGKYVDSMQAIFQKLDTKMVFDINHCLTNDPSLFLAKEMAEQFEDRITEVHLSGFESSHELLHITEQLEILQAIPNKNLPIIIEGVCESEEEAKKEFAYIKKYLLKK
jgi:hypothetical protein